MAEERASKLSPDTEGEYFGGEPYVEQHRCGKGHFGEYVNYYKEMDEVRQYYEDEK